MSAWTKDREARVRATLAAFLAVMGPSQDPADPMTCLADALAALTDERARREAAERERDEALADATRWREEQAEIDADLSDADDWIAENAKIRALPEAERAAAVEDARARGVFDGEGREPADYTDLMRTAATMPGFVRACMQLKEASARADRAEAERDEARAALAALREAARRWSEAECDVAAGVYALRGSGPGAQEAAREALAACDAITDALSAAAPIAGRYRASVLREAKRICDERGAAAQDAGDLVGWQACTGCGHAIEALANAAEKGEGHE